GFEEKRPEAVALEDFFGNDGAREKRAELRRAERHHREQGVSKRVFHKDREPSEPARSSGDDVELAKDIAEASPNLPREDRGERGPKGDGGQDQAEKAARIVSGDGQKTEVHGENEDEE